MDLFYVHLMHGGFRFAQMFENGDGSSHSTGRRGRSGDHFEYLWQVAMTLGRWDHNPKLHRTDAAALDLGKFERSAYSQAIERLDQYCGVRPGID
jgi:hypothetical protein